MIRIFIFSILACLSCQTGKELHYFKSGNNYYRLRVKECTFLTSSRYLSGYFDERAVDNYFDEIYRKSGVSPIYLDSTKRYVSRNENAKFLILLSTENEAISTAIGQFASNEQTLALVASMDKKNITAQTNQLKLDSLVLRNLKTNIDRTIDFYKNKIKTDSSNYKYYVEQLNEKLNNLLISSTK